MSPKRIQRNGLRGKLPPNCRLVARPSGFQNTFDWQALGRPEAVRQFREYVESNPAFQILIRRELRGLDLACYCPLDEPCHADVLLEYANK